MADDADLGLFPLDLVLLPGEAVALHLFEPRYRQLYADAVLEDALFVVVRQEDERRERVGCAARFEELTRRHPDGRMDVVVRGARVVEVLEPTGGRMYDSARVRPLADDAGEAGAEERARMLAGYVELAGSPPTDDGEVPLSYAAAAGLPLDAPSKQALLEERSEARRVAMLGEAIERTLARNARTTEYARRASTNGHVPHP